MVISKYSINTYYNRAMLTAVTCFLQIKYHQFIRNDRREDSRSKGCTVHMVLVQKSYLYHSKWKKGEKTLKSIEVNCWLKVAGDYI